MTYDPTQPTASERLEAMEDAVAELLARAMLQPLSVRADLLVGRRLAANLPDLTYDGTCEDCSG